MKVATILIAASTGAFAATPLQTVCGTIGQPCSTVQKAAEAAAFELTKPTTGSSFPEGHPSKTLSDYCHIPGNKCSVAARASEDLETTLHHVYNLAAESAGEEITKRDANADPRRSNAVLHGLCGFRGQACGRKRSAEASPDAYANPSAYANDKVLHGLCGFRGQACGRKRDANADPRRSNAVLHGLCGFRGQACGRRAKRDVEAKRAAEDIEAAQPEVFKHLCHGSEESCGKIVKAAAAAHKVLARAAEEEAKSEKYSGMSAEEFAKAHEECHKEGNPCHIATRAAEDLVDALDRAVVTVS